MKKLIGAVGVAAVSFVLTACNEQNCFYPAPPNLLQTGLPRIEFFKKGPGYGPIVITMPDGEVLNGGYQIAPNASYKISPEEVQMFSPFDRPYVRQVVISARGRLGTTLDCTGAIDLCGNGSAACRTNRGQDYHVAF